MERFVIEQNITRFADRLGTELGPAERNKMRKLLLEEEDRFGRRSEQLSRIDIHIGNCKDRVARQRALVDMLAMQDAQAPPIDGAADRDLERARRVLSNLVELQKLFEGYRHAIANAADEMPLSDPQLHHAALGPFGLTAREMEVLVHVSRGRPSREIAERLGLTERTVSAHRQSICAKLRVVNSAAAVAVAIRAGILKY